jgi:hypothetical protein
VCEGNKALLPRVWYPPSGARPSLSVCRTPPALGREEPCGRTPPVECRSGGLVVAQTPPCCDPASTSFVQRDSN